MSITPISDNESLAEFCASLKGAPYVAIDTEFVREKTYWPIVCLIQVAGPNNEAVIDALSPSLVLEPLARLLRDESTLKVFHAGRQDIEIFYNLFKTVPKPIFDTQVAAMVCGFGDQVAYGNLVQKLLGVNLEKTSRFADWSRRPLTQKQLQYALADVVHLRDVYQILATRLEKTGRAEWLDEEMAVLTNPSTYRMDPREAWRRIKSRSGNPRFLAVLREVTAWREEEAQRRDVPRNRILRDDSLLDIAAHTPRTADSLSRTRGIPRGFANSKAAGDLIAAVKRGMETPEADLPEAESRERLPGGLGPVTDLLKTLLKLRCEETDVAPKLVASAEDIERIAAFDDADVPALKGWRREVFGEQALALKQGKLGLTTDGKRLRIIEISGRGQTRPGR